MNAASANAIAWLGPSNGPLGELRKKVEQTQQVDQLDLIEAARSPHGLHGYARFIVACEERLSYPIKDLHRLRQLYPEIPLAVALGRWWEGAARTGLREPEFLHLPWHAWWNGWISWLESAHVAAQPFTRIADFMVNDMHQTDVSSHLPNTVAPSSASSGLIIAGSLDTQTALRDRIRPFAEKVVVKSRFDDPPDLDDALIDWVLVDDSCVDTLLGASFGVQQLAGTLHQVHTALPNAKIGLRCSAAGIDAYLEAAQDFELELFVKPETGSGILRWLTQLNRLATT